MSLSGTVDNVGRAVISVPLRAAPAGAATAVEVWIDTGFNGDLVLPQNAIDALGLAARQRMRAALADGSEVELKTFAAEIDWFGGWRPVEVIANDGRHPLLGVGLLLGRQLHIDYARLTLTVS